ASFIVLLVSGVLLVEDKRPKDPAESLFRTLEEKLARSETIQVKFKSVTDLKKDKPDEKQVHGTLTGVLLLRKRNKLRLELDGSLPGQDPTKYVVVSDG